MSSSSPRSAPIESDSLERQPQSASPRRYPGRARGSELLASAILAMIFFPPLSVLVWYLARNRLAAVGRLSASERGLTDTARLIALVGVVWFAMLATWFVIGNTASFLLQ